MKKLLFATILLASFNCVASEHEYDASGVDENGRNLSGSIYSEPGDTEINGTLTDDNGNEHEFSGEWDGTGSASGELDDGTTIDLDVE